jgi:ferredoxin
MFMEVPRGADLLKYQRVVIDQETCISCGACVAVCPVSALELAEDNFKSTLLWDKCIDDFSCIGVCPVNAIHKTSEAPQELKARNSWYRFSRELSDDEKRFFEEWRKKYGVTGNPK